MIKVGIIGANGRMGQEAVKAVLNDSSLELHAKIARGDSAATSLKGADVAVELSTIASVYKNTKEAVLSGCHVVVGATGITPEQRDELHQLALENDKGIAVIPNFSIGAVMMMKVAAEIAKVMDSAEIIELHHNMKVDAPSGTALITADKMADANPHLNAKKIEEKEIVKGARGGQYRNIPIHSVRLDGFVASQEIMFGGVGQTLKIRHDSINRVSFMPGLILAVKKVSGLRGLVYGLENFL